MGVTLPCEGINVLATLIYSTLKYGQGTQLDDYPHHLLIFSIETMIVYMYVVVRNLHYAGGKHYLDNQYVICTYCTIIMMCTHRLRGRAPVS